MLVHHLVQSGGVLGPTVWASAWQSLSLCPFVPYCPSITTIHRPTTSFPSIAQHVPNSTYPVPGHRKNQKTMSEKEASETVGNDSPGSALNHHLLSRCLSHSPTALARLFSCFSLLKLSLIVIIAISVPRAIATPHGQGPTTPTRPMPGIISVNRAGVEMNIITRAVLNGTPATVIGNRRLNLASAAVSPGFFHSFISLLPHGRRRCLIEREGEQSHPRDDAWYAPTTDRPLLV